MGQSGHSNAQHGSCLIWPQALSVTLLQRCMHLGLHVISDSARRLFWPQALSVTLRQRTLDSAMRNVGKLKAAVDKCKATDAQRLRAEYDRLLGGLHVRSF
jgi:uncharacterized protein YaiI (UPF0178 family)